MMNTFTLYPTAYNNEDSAILMSVPELAEYLGIGRNRAYDLLRDNAIKGFKIGCTWKVSKTAVDKFIYERSGLI